MIEEPRVKVSTIDYSTLPSNIPDSLNLGMVIDSDEGPVKISRVNNQQEFIKTYLSGNQLNLTDSDTVKHAFKLLQFMPIYVTRAMDNSVFGGITNNGDPIYTDTDFQVMKYYKQLSFHETEANYKSVMMKLKVSTAANFTASMFYSGNAPDYVAPIAKGEDNTYYGIMPQAPKAESGTTTYDYIIDTKDYGKYRIDSISSSNLVTVSKVDSIPENVNIYTYSFNVNFHNQFILPGFSDLYSLGSVVYLAPVEETDTPEYYTVTSATKDDNNNIVIGVNLVNKIDNGAVNILNLLTGYNASNYNNLSKFYTIGESGDQLITTISNTTSLIELGYKTKDSGPYELIEIESTLESNKYKQFSQTSNKSLTSENYLTINGFTYYNNTDSSSNYLYPYVGVNFNESSMDIVKFFTYIYDYQVSNEANIIPSSLETKVTMTLPIKEIILSGDFANKYIVTENKNDSDEITSLNLTLLNNSKVTKGYVVLKGAVVNTSESTTTYSDLIYHVGYESNPVIEATESYFMYDIEGNKVIHSSGKLLFEIINDYTTTIDTGYNIATSGYSYTPDTDNSRILYLSSSLESYEKSSEDFVNGPSTAGSNYRYSFANDESILGTKVYSGLQLIIDDYLFYNVSYSTKNPDLIPVRLSSSPLTFIQFLRHLRRIVGNYFNSINSDNGLTLMTNDPDEYSTIDFTGDGIEMDEVISTNNAGIVTSAKFAIINKCPSKKKNLMFSLTQDTDDPELWNLVITRKTDETSYTISFIEDKVDGYGRNVYYTYVNEMNDYIQLVKLDGDDPIIVGTYTSELFGNEVPIASPESDDFVASVNRFNDNEGIYYDFIFDGGYANMVYAKGIFEVCKNIYAEGLLTLPQITDPDQLIKYRKDCGIDTEQGWRCVMRGNWINDTTVADFLIRMSPMCAYVEKIANNKTGMKEFAPVFGATNSSITYDAGFYINKKSIREELLSQQIPVIVDDKSLGLRYWNLDTTLKVVDSSLCDANNCRMINVCAHICDNQMKWYIGQFNTPEVRSNVTESLTNLISDRLIKNQQYKLAGLRVICNESNNPTSVIENRELVVDIAMQFLPGIRYINVFQKVYKLSQDLNAL